MELSSPFCHLLDSRAESPNSSSSLSKQEDPDRVHERKKKVYEAVQKTRQKQKLQKELEEQTLAFLDEKVSQLFESLLNKEPKFPKIPVFIGEKVPEDDRDRRHKPRDKRRKALTPEEKITRAKLQNTESQQRRINRQKIEDLNRRGKILFLERQLKYLNAIHKSLDNEGRKNPMTVRLEFSVLTRLLLTPKYQVPPDFLLSKRQKKKRNISSSFEAK